MCGPGVTPYSAPVWLQGSCHELDAFHRPSGDIAPGARLARHKHPFSRYAYVLAGDLTVEFDGGKQRQYHTGDIVVEAVDTWHFGSNSGTVPVRLLVIDQVEEGQSSTIPAK